MLKIAGASSVASFGIGAKVLPVIAASNASGHVAAVYGSESNPVTQSEIADVQDEVLEKYRGEANTDRLLVVGSPLPPEEQTVRNNHSLDNPLTDRKVVSYALKVYPNGKTQYYASSVDPKEDESRKESAEVGHERTNEFMSWTENKDKPEPLSNRRGR